MWARCTGFDVLTSYLPRGVWNARSKSASRYPDSDFTSMLDLQPTTQVLPRWLYKYRYFDTESYHIRTVEGPELWFCDIDSINDPFDAKLHYDFSDEPTGIQLKWAVDAFNRHRPDLGSAERGQEASELARQMAAHPEVDQQVKDQHLNRIRQRFGLCSLSMVSDDLLMWAHYSKDHTGFCVGYDVQFLSKYIEDLFHSERKVIAFEPIRYSDAMPKVNFFQSRLSNQTDSDLLELLCTKSNHWSYEQEFRLFFHDGVNVPLRLPFEAISKVIFGCRIAAHDRSRVVDYLTTNAPSIQLYQSAIDESVFRLNFEQIN